MASRLQDDFSEAALPDMMEYAGVDCVYTPPTGDPVELRGVFDKITGEVDQMREGRRIYRSARLVLCKDPASEFGGVAEPSLRATVTVTDTGEIYAISDVLAEFCGWIVLRVTSSGVMSRERHDLRRDKGRSAGRDPRRFAT